MHVCLQNILFGSVGVTSTHLNAFKTSMYLPVVLNNNGDKLKKKVLIKWWLEPKVQCMESPSFWLLGLTFAF